MTERRHAFPFPCVDNNKLRPGMSDSEVHVLASDDLEKGSADLQQSTMLSTICKNIIPVKR